MRRRPGGLWRHPDFLKLWVGETVSLLGSQVTLLALPLTAVLTLHANAAQMGYLTAIQLAPSLLAGLFAGVWIDRVRRRPIMIAADLGRFALLLGIPLLAVAGRLGMAGLYPIAFLVGILTVCFDVAYQAFLPSLVGREQLVEGNARLEVSRSGALIAGPGLAGLLVGLVTAPFAIAADAASFLGSALFLLGIRTPEPVPVDHGTSRGTRREIAEGLGIVLGNPLLRAIAGSTGTSNLFSSAISAIVILYATRNLGIGPGLLGLI
ncbi:MAG TPA: MFS transporter [Thermomicrobiaceae bacterium]|nr:MFS transporter [Thermomicrobiaceae bacterium]